MSNTKKHIDKRGHTRDLNERQRKFCELYVYGVKQDDGSVKHPNLCDCYTLAGYETAGYNRASLRTKASHLLEKEHIQNYIDQLRDKLEENALEQGVWNRDQLLKEIRQIFDDAVKASLVPIKNDEGDVIGNAYDSKAANVALKATQQVAQMLGFNEPEKVENKFVVEFTRPEVSRWAK